VVLLCVVPARAEAQAYRSLLGAGWTFMEAGNFRKAEESFKAAFATPEGKNAAEVYYAIAALWWERRNAMASYMWLSDAEKASRGSFNWDGGPDGEWDQRIEQRRGYIQRNFGAVRLRSPSRGAPLAPLIDPAPTDPLLAEFSDNLPTVIAEGVAEKVAVQWVLLPSGDYWVGDEIMQLPAGQLEAGKAPAWELAKDTGKSRKVYEGRVAAIEGGMSPAAEAREAQSAALAAQEAASKAEIERIAAVAAAEEAERLAKAAAEREAAAEAERAAQAARDADAKAEAIAMAEAARDAKAKAEAQASREADERAARDAAAKADADAKAQAARDAAAKADADAKAQAARDAAAKADADAKAARDAAAKADADAKAQAARDASEKAARDAEAQAKAAAEQSEEKREAERLALADADAKEKQQRIAKVEADARARAEADERAAAERAESTRLAEERKERDWQQAQARAAAEQEREKEAEKLRREELRERRVAPGGPADDVFATRRLALSVGGGGSTVTQMTADSSSVGLDWNAQTRVDYIVPIKGATVALPVGLSWSNVPVSGCSHKQTRANAVSLHAGPRFAAPIKGRLWFAGQIGGHIGGGLSLPTGDVRNQCATESLKPDGDGVAYGARMIADDGTAGRLSLADLGWSGWALLVGPDGDLGILGAPGAGPTYLGVSFFVRYDQVIPIVRGTAYQFQAEGSSSPDLSSVTLETVSGRASMARFQFGLRGRILF